MVRNATEATMTFDCHSKMPQRRVNSKSKKQQRSCMSHSWSGVILIYRQLDTLMLCWTEVHVIYLLCIVFTRINQSGDTVLGKVHVMCAFLCMFHVFWSDWSQGGYLARIRDMGDNLFVGALVANGASHFWIDTGIHIIIQDFMLMLHVT